MTKVNWKRDGGGVAFSISEVSIWIPTWKEMKLDSCHAVCKDIAKWIERISSVAWDSQINLKQDTQWTIQERMINWTTLELRSSYLSKYSIKKRKGKSPIGIRPLECLISIQNYKELMQINKKNCCISFLSWP